MKYTIREAVPELKDAAELLEIYRPYVEETAITFEYDVPTVEEFRGRIENTLQRYPYLVLEDETGQPAGYAYASAFKEREAYDWAIETSIYLRQDCRGAGLGAVLYDALEDILKLQHISNVNACIAWARPENDHLDNTSVRFHEKEGYTMVGTFHQCGYKFGQWYDMVWMEKIIGPHEKQQPPMLPFPQVQAAADAILLDRYRTIVRRGNETQDVTDTEH